MSKIKTNEQRPFLTLDEASQYLGISKNTIYRYTSQGALIFYKLRNRKLYFKIDDLDEFVLNEKNKITKKESGSVDNVENENESEFNI